MNTQLGDNDGVIQVHVPMAIKRRSGRKEMIVPDGLTTAAGGTQSYHEALVVAIPRAHRFKKMLDEGKYGSVAEMAGALKMSRYQMARMLRLTLLAPPIIQAVLDGHEPDGLTLNRLVRAINPVWSDQLDEYGLHSKA